MACETREKIIKSASVLFYASSYADVGVQAICVHAGVKKGSFYHFFNTKTELVLAVIDYLNADFLENILKPAFSPEIPPLERFGRMVEIIQKYNHITREQGGAVLGCPFGNLAIELSTRDNDLRLSLDKIFVEMKRVFFETLEQARRDGEVGDIDLDASADALVAFFEGVALLSKTRNDPDLIEKLSPMIKNFFVPR